MMNENDELILEDDGNLYWQITTEDESLKMLKMRPRIGEVEEEFVDVVQDVLKELKRLRERNDRLREDLKRTRRWIQKQVRPLKVIAGQAELVACTADKEILDTCIGDD